jgi:hypothetical protein
MLLFSFPHPGPLGSLNGRAIGRNAGTTITLASIGTALN